MTKKRSRVWIWFFVVLAVLALIAGSIEIWFNLSQQLNPEQVANAQKLWREHAPAEYEIDFIFSRMSRQPLHYRAVIRNREVTAVMLNDQELEPVLYPLHDLPPLFEAAAAWLAEDPARQDGVVDHVLALDATATYHVRVRPGETTVSRNGASIPARLTAVYLPAAQIAAFARQLELDRQPDAGCTVLRGDVRSAERHACALRSQRHGHPRAGADRRDGSQNPLNRVQDGGLGAARTFPVTSPKPMR